MYAMRNIAKFFVFVSLALLTSCSTKYYEYSGDSVILGSGGASKNVDGIDIWIDGTPPRRFQIIGFIEDSRPGRGPAMALRNKALASKAREHGGHGVLVRAEQIENSFGFQSGSLIMTSPTTAIGSGFLIRPHRNNSKFYVIRYLN